MPVAIIVPVPSGSRVDQTRARGDTFVICLLGLVGVGLDDEPAETSPDLTGCQIRSLGQDQIQGLAGHVIIDMTHTPNHRSHLGHIDQAGLQSLQQRRVPLHEVIGVLHLPIGRLSGEGERGCGLGSGEFVEVEVDGVFDVEVGNPSKRPILPGLIMGDLTLLGPGEQDGVTPVELLDVDRREDPARRGPGGIASKP